jgi:hypothetical protein
MITACPTTCYPVVDSDNFLLLRPATAGSGVLLAGTARRPAQEKLTWSAVMCLG